MATHSSFLAWETPWTVPWTVADHSPQGRRDLDTTEHAHTVIQMYLVLYILNGAFPVAQW